MNKELLEKPKHKKETYREDGSKDRQPGRKSGIVWAARDWVRKDKALTEFEDYRLSLIPVLGKIAEQIILETLLRHMENKKVLVIASMASLEAGAGAEESLSPAGSCCPSDQLSGRLHTAFSTTKCSVCYFFFPPQAGLFFRILIPLFGN